MLTRKGQQTVRNISPGAYDGKPLKTPRAKPILVLYEIRVLIGVKSREVFSECGICQIPSYRESRFSGLGNEEVLALPVLGS